jgi:hypothetical protein
MAEIEYRSKFCAVQMAPNSEGKFIEKGKPAVHEQKYQQVSGPIFEKNRPFYFSPHSQFFLQVLCKYGRHAGEDTCSGV